MPETENRPGPEETPEVTGAESDSRSGLWELALVFLRLGSTAFGGPAAHIAMMEDNIVERRRWISRERFLDLIGATNLIPGPNSTEMAIHIGYHRGGWPGLMVAGVCFIIPSMLIVLGLAWAYVKYGSLPELTGLLSGVKPVVIAIVLQALWRFGRAVLKTGLLWSVGALSVALILFGWNEILVLLLGAIMMMIGKKASEGLRGCRSLALVPLVPVGGVIATVAAAMPFGLWPLFLFFAKVGSVLFGSGYVLLAFLKADLVERWGWLTETQLLDAIAIGQVTPGPVFTTATFIGYILGGTTGAIVATAGIFLPAFFFVAISGPLVTRIRRSRLAGIALDGVNVASLALMGVVTLQLGREVMAGIPAVGIFLVSAVLLFRFRINSVWLVLGGAVLGLLLRMVFRV